MQFTLLRYFLLLCTCLAFGLALPGCGKKGNLYLPDTAAAIPTNPQSTPPAQKQP